MSAFTTRPATTTDLGELFALHRTVFRPHIESLWGWDETWQRERFLEEFEVSETTVIECGGQAVGYCQLNVSDERIYLRNLAVHPDAQGRGIGTQVVAALQRRAAKARVPLELSLFRTNPRAEQLYKRLGFVRYREDVAYLRMRWIAR